MYISFLYKTFDSNINKSIAQYASLALTLWVNRWVENRNPKIIGGLPCFIGEKIIGAYHPMFMTVLTSMTERTINKTPVIPEILFNKNWYGSLPDALSVDKAIESNNEKVLFYEQVCLNILHWMNVEGLIYDLSVTDIMPPDFFNPPEE